jgi:hypothetical protein
MNRDDILYRLFRAGSDDGPPADMPYGFETRVLALARSGPRNGAIATLIRRTAFAAIAVIALAGAGAYRASMADNDFSSEYAMADAAIQNNLGE